MHIIMWPNITAIAKVIFKICDIVFMHYENVTYSHLFFFYFLIRDKNTFQISKRTKKLK